MASHKALGRCRGFLEAPAPLTLARRPLLTPLNVGPPLHRVSVRLSLRFLVAPTFGNHIVPSRVTLRLIKARVSLLLLALAALALAMPVALKVT